jgi:hypothetical protein
MLVEFALGRVGQEETTPRQPVFQHFDIVGGRPDD